MNVHDIASTVIAGGMLGMLGQGIRIAVGLKKLNDQNTANMAKNIAPEPFDSSRLILSLFTGFVAGALALLMKTVADNSVATLTSDSLVTIIAVGYSGADFIEGFFNMYVKKFLPTTTTNVVGPQALATIPPVQPPVSPPSADQSGTAQPGATLPTTKPDPQSTPPASPPRSLNL